MGEEINLETINANPMEKWSR